VQTLRINEIFYSLQGESRTVGLPTVFIRLTGCPLRCHYCDTEYAFYKGEQQSLEAILTQVKQYNTSYVTVTGGEPLAQKACLDLLSQLCDQDYQVSLETSGALDVSEVDQRVSKVMDLKTPDSGESDKNLWDNLDYLNPHDQLKFVICSLEDYEWAKTMLDVYALTERCELLFSPIHGELSPQDLAEWILEDQLAVRFQLQLHKYLWNDEPGR
jgi:7-carboxy-7-deazaguanine synthase